MVYAIRWEISDININVKPFVFSMKIWNINILISTVNLKFFMSWAKKNTIFRRIIFCMFECLNAFSIVNRKFVLFRTNE